MIFTDIKDLKYVTEDKSRIDLFATCIEYGKIPMTLNLVDTEDLHIHIDENGIETPLKVYCKTLNIEHFESIKMSNEQRIQSIKAKASEIILLKYSLEKQISAKLGLYGQEYLDIMVAFIRDIIEQSNKLEIDETKTAEDFVIIEI